MLSRILVLAGVIATALAETTTLAARDQSSTTVKVLAGTMTSGLAGSVISANPCDTTYAFTCTDLQACSGYALTITVTEGPSNYNVRYSTSIDGGEGLVSETCSLSGTTYAVCAETVSVSISGTSTSTSTTSTFSGSQLQYAQVPITAGAEMLASATGSCTSSGSGAAPTGISEIYKVLVVPAAAVAVAAGAML